MKDVISALSYLHDKCYFHRDVRSENILIDQNGRAYFSGFGILSNFTISKAQSMVDTPTFIAPETK